jgi:hypothetical protein
MMESEEMRIIERKHLEAVDRETNPGMKKQFELQMKWLKDNGESQGE